VRIGGEASDSTESFAFTIEAHAAGGYMLSIKFSGDDRDGMTGAGIWPSIEKAKEIAQGYATPSRGQNQLEKFKLRHYRIGPCF
jgi:hypothetical protein